MPSPHKHTPAGRMALAFVDSDWCDGMTPDTAEMVHEGFAHIQKIERAGE